MAKSMKRVLVPKSSIKTLRQAIEDVCFYLSEQFGMDAEDEETKEVAIDLVATVLLASGYEGDEGESV